MMGTNGDCRFREPMVSANRQRNGRLSTPETPTNLLLASKSAGSARYSEHEVFSRVMQRGKTRVATRSNRPCMRTVFYFAHIKRG